MTGGARGYCNPSGTWQRPWNARGARGFGRGFGFRHGFGYGQGFRAGAVGVPPAPYYPAYPMDAKDELRSLNAEAQFLKQQLSAIQTRIDELGKNQTE